MKRMFAILLSALLLQGCWGMAKHDQQRIKAEMGDDQIACAGGDHTACMSYFADKVIAEQCTNWEVGKRQGMTADPNAAIGIVMAAPTGYFSMINSKCEGETRKMVQTFISCQNGDQVSCMDLAADNVAAKNAAQVQALESQWKMVQAMQTRP